jgi:hypothetical protein
MTFEQTTGTRAQVWHGTAKKTSGGLTKTALMMNKHGRIVSRKKHNTAKKEKRLVKAGFLTKKGQFGFIKKGTRRHRSRKMRGGDMDEDSDSDMGEGMMGGTGRKMMGGTSCASGRGKMMGGTGYPMETGFPNTSPMGRALSVGGRRRRGSRRMSGGMALGGPLSPLAYDGQGVGTSGVNLQFVAGAH